MKATGSGKVMAKLWGMIFPYLEGEKIDERVRWMPAHRKEEEVQALKDSRGSSLSVHDVIANDAVDKMAKKAVEEHRASEQARVAFRKAAAKLRMIAFSIGMATRCANDPDE